MADLLAIQQLMARYCYAHDEQDAHTAASYFAENGAIQGKRGPAEVERWLSSIYHGLTKKRRHVQSNFLFLEETDTTATVQAYQQLYLIADEKVELHLTAIYRVEVELIDGQWKFIDMSVSTDTPFNPGDTPDPNTN